MFDVIIIGNGPAGLSAALYTKRAGLDTLIIGRDNGSLAKADKIENYFVFPSRYREKSL
jgi:thioredoxin reductase (NADPH)